MVIKRQIKRKYIVNVTFYLIIYDRGDIVLSLSIINPLHESLELVFILGSLIFFNY